MIEVKLEKHELMALDGKVNAEAQRVIDRLKRIDSVSTIMKLDDKDAAFVSDAIDEAQRSKMLIRYRCSVSKCRVCGKGATPIYYKSGRSRGKVKGYVDIPGYDLAESFIRVDGYPKVGACSDCINRLMPFIVAALDGMEIEVKVPGEICKWRRLRNRKCTKCGWSGHEGEMKKERALMGDGWYPAGCPNCTARNGFGYSEIDIADGYTMVPFQQEKETK